MNSSSFDFVLAVAALIIGIMLLTGNGAIFMGGGNKDKRRQKYDQKKMETACGVAMILVAVHELIPECQQNQKTQPYFATMGIVTGFAVMMLLDVMLG